MSYEIIINKEGRQGIKCLECGMISGHPTDIKEKYCAFCRKFHEDGPRNAQ